MVKTCSFLMKAFLINVSKRTKMIQRTVVLPEAALLLGKKTLRLEGPLEAGVDHPLHRFTQTAG